MKILLMNAGQGPDYLADLVNGEIISSGKFHITTNNLPEYLFDDFPDPGALYGNGYTVFAKIPAEKKNHVHIYPERVLLEKISQKFFDKIIYTSIWRYNLLLSESINAYGCNDIIVLDGEDHTNILSITNEVEYFKRELVPSFEQVCKSISFSFPSFYPKKNFEPIQKRQFLAPCVPGMLKSYIYTNEKYYYAQYMESYFGLTTKKGGWDCMRHYEIIYAGCIPYFPDIIDKPRTTMIDYPVPLQLRANKIFEMCLYNPKLIENEKNEELRDLNDCFRSWLGESGTSTLYLRLLGLL